MLFDLYDCSSHILYIEGAHRSELLSEKHVESVPFKTLLSFLDLSRRERERRGLECNISKQGISSEPRRSGVGHIPNIMFFIGSIMELIAAEDVTPKHMEYMHKNKLSH